MPKRFKGTKIFLNYKELCTFLEIEPASRGTAKEQQLKELQKTYNIVKHNSGRYEVTYLTQKERDYKAGITGGWIQTIDGIEVNLKSPKCFQHTRINDYILHCALNTNIETMRDFQILCFHQCSYFYKLLNKKYSGTDGLDSLQKQYDTFFITKADELISGRLDDRVDYLLEQFEKKGYIKLERFYRLSNDSTASINTIQPYVNKALEELGCKNEYYACRSKSIREKYFQIRNELYQKGEDTGLEIKRKELHIIPLLSPSDDRYPHLNQVQCSEILTSFFKVFRAKLLYEFTTNEKIRKSQIPSKLKIGIQEKTAEQIVSEIIEKYCTYEATSNDVSFDIKQFNYYAVSELENTSSETPEEKPEITTTEPQ